MTKLLWIAACLTTQIASAQVRTYRLAASAGDRMELTVEKTGLLSGKKHLFVFNAYEGRVDFDPNRPEGAKVTLTIESKSIVCKDTWVSTKDLRKIEKVALDDMLAADRHATIGFVSSNVKPTGPGKFEVEGALTIRGISKPAVATVGFKENGKGGLEFEGTSRIRMTAYGLKPPGAALGAIGTKDEMTLVFSLTARGAE